MGSERKNQGPLFFDFLQKFMYSFFSKTVHKAKKTVHRKKKLYRTCDVFAKNSQNMRKIQNLCTVFFVMYSFCTVFLTKNCT